MQEYTLEPANFYDYRDFLKHRFDSLNGHNKNFSLQNCAKRSELSKSLLQFLFTKQRHISLDRLPALAKTLKLTPDEEYFVYLKVCRDASQNPTIQQHFESILDKVRHQYITTTIQGPVQAGPSEKSLYQNHMLQVLRTLARLDGFKEDPKWILEQLFIKGVTEKEITSTLKELEELGYLYRDQDSKLVATPETVWRPDPYDPTGMNVYTRAAASIAELMKYPASFRPSVYMEMSLAFDEENLLKAEKFMIEVHHRLSAMAAESKNPTAAAHIGNFFLTLARLKK